MFFNKISRGNFLQWNQLWNCFQLFCNQLSTRNVFQIVCNEISTENVFEVDIQARFARFASFTRFVRFARFARFAFSRGKSFFLGRERTNLLWEIPKFCEKNTFLEKNCFFLFSVDFWRTKNNNFFHPTTHVTNLSLVDVFRFFHEWSNYFIWVTLEHNNKFFKL